MKKAYIIHGWGGFPEEGWFPWLRKELESKGFKVFVPKMPKADEPKIEEWVGFLKRYIKNPDKETYLIGHSIGCQTIMRYMEILPKTIKIRNVIFVAGWFNLTKKVTENLEESKIANPWLKTPIDFEKVKMHSNKFIAIFSDDDPFVPLTDSKIFKGKLNAKIIILKNKGHLGGEHNINELPKVLNVILEG